MPKQTPKTLIDFISQAQSGGEGFFFDDPKHVGKVFAAMNQDFSDGNYRLSEAQMQSARILGQEIIDYAKQNNVDLAHFPEVKAAMGYDQNRQDLSAEELGAFLVGYAMQNRTFADQFGKITSTLKATNSFRLNGEMNEATDVALELGRQVYGDTRPQQSSTNTSSTAGNDRTMQKLANSPNLDKVR